MTHAFLRAFAELYRRNGLAVAMAVSFGMALFLIAGIASQGHLFVPGLGADFYAVFPHNTLVILFGLPAVWSLVALCVGLIRFWRQISASNESIARLDAIGEAAASVLTLITTAAMATAATMRTTPSPCGAGASITWPSRGSCSALRRSRWPPFITVCGVSRGDADNKIPAWRGLRRGLLLVTLTGAIQIFTDSLNCSQ